MADAPLDVVSKYLERDSRDGEKRSTLRSKARMSIFVYERLREYLLL